VRRLSSLSSQKIIVKIHVRNRNKAIPIDQELGDPILSLIRITTKTDLDLVAISEWVSKVEAL
jgi:hypothetical protein